MVNMRSHSYGEVLLLIEFINISLKNHNWLLFHVCQIEPYLLLVTEMSYPSWGPKLLLTGICPLISDNAMLVYMS